VPAGEARRYRRARRPDRKYAIALGLERLARARTFADETGAEIEAFLVELWNRLMPFIEKDDADATAMIEATRETAAKWHKDETRPLAYVERELRRDELAFDF